MNILLQRFCYPITNLVLGSFIRQHLPFKTAQMNGLFNAALFLDSQKAFDTINHDILMKKLGLYGLEKPALNILKSYLVNRTQMCSVNGIISNIKLLHVEFLKALFLILFYS